MKTLTIEDRPTVRCVKARTPHGVTDKLIIKLYWDGTIGIREYRRREEHQLDLGVLITSAITKAALAKKRERKKLRAT